MLFFLIIIVVIIYYVITKDYKDYFTKDQKNPESQLKERFVKGEIDEQTYYKMKSVITGKENK